MTAEEIALQMEIELIRNISKAVGSGKIGTADWYIRKMAEIGRLTEQNQRIIEGYIADLDGAMRNEITVALQERLKTVDIAFSSAGFQSVSAAADAGIFELIASYAGSVAGKANLIGNNMLAGSAQSYQNILTVTQNEVLAGISTPQDALRKTLTKWAEKGIPALYDKAGREWQADSYVNMQIRTAQTAGYTDMTLQRNQQYGNDLIEIDSHVGSREGCAPYQGRIFSQSGSSEEYPSLSSTTYGEPDGIFGVNCRHNLYVFIPGFSEKTYSPYPKEQNEDAYKNSQKQRYLERQIRAAKRQLAAAEEQGGNVSVEKAKVRNAQANMRTFIDETGRTRQRQKEQIAG